MSDNLEAVGVQLVADGEQVFTRTLDSASKAMEAFTNQIKVNTAAMAANPATASATAITSSLSGLSRILPDVTGGLGSFGDSMTNSVIKGNLLSSALESLGTAFKNSLGKIVDYGDKVNDAAGRFDQLMRISYLLGAQQGKTRDQIDGLVAGIRAQGIQADIAAKLVTDFSKANLDLNKAVELGKVAQNAAQIAGQDSSGTLDRLLAGIMTLQPEILRTNGIIVNTDKAMKDYAASNNVAVGAMSGAQRQQAMLNAVLEAGIPILGAYEASLDSGYKVWQSLKRVLNDIMIALGTPFQKLNFNVAQFFYEGAKAVSTFVQEGGFLYDILQNIGASLAVVTDPFRKWIESFQKSTKFIKDESKNFEIFRQDMLNMGMTAEQINTQWQEQVSKEGWSKPFLDELKTWADNIVNFATQAFDWGFNIVLQFADGIMNAVSSVLVAAMNSIGSILDYFLSPGSPPKVAPELDDWGKKAINEFIYGMTEGDFSLLSSIGGSIQKAFSLYLDPAQAASAFSGIMVSMSDTFNRKNKGEAVDFEGIFADISKNAGDAAKSLTDMVKQEIKVYELGEKIKKANEAIAKADETKASAMDEYNALARKGAPKNELDAKRKVFELAQKSKVEAKKTLAEAEKSYNLEKEKLGLLKQQFDFVTQMLSEYEKARKEEAMLNKLAGEGKKGGAGGGGGIDPEKIKKQIEEAGKAALDAVTEKLRIYWQGKMTQITNSYEKWKKDLMGVGTAFGTLSTKIGNFYNQYLKPTVDKLMSLNFKPLQDAILNLDFESIGKELGNLFVSISSIFETTLLPSLTILYNKTMAWIEKNKPTFEKWGEDVGTWVGGALVNLSKSIADFSSGFQAAVLASGTAESVGVWIGTAIVEKLFPAAVFTGKVLTDLQTGMATAFGIVVGGIAKGFRDAFLAELGIQLPPALSEGIPRMVGEAFAMMTWGGVIKKITEPFKNISLISTDRAFNSLGDLDSRIKTVQTSLSQANSAPIPVFDNVKTQAGEAKKAADSVVTSLQEANKLNISATVSAPLATAAAGAKGLDDEFGSMSGTSMPAFATAVTTMTNPALVGMNTQLATAKNYNIPETTTAVTDLKKTGLEPLDTAILKLADETIKKLMDQFDAINKKIQDEVIAKINNLIIKIGQIPREITIDIYVVEHSSGGVWSPGGENSNYGCFTKDMRVLTPDGYRAIANLEIGDEVMAYDETDRSLKVSKIDNVFRHEGEGSSSHLYLVELEDGRIIETTMEHKFATVFGDWQPIGSFPIGSSVLDKDMKPVRITKTVLRNKKTDVYNIEVNKYHTYIVEGIVVHNAKARGGYMGHNNATLVGENGPELFTPGYGNESVKGWITSNEVMMQQFDQMINSAVASRMAFTRSKGFGATAFAARSRSSMLVGANGSNSTNYVMNVQTQLPMQSVQQGFATLKLLNS